MQYVPTVYERIVRDCLSLNLQNFESYRKDWQDRGYNIDDFHQYVEDIKYAVLLLKVFSPF